MNIRVEKAMIERDNCFFKDMSIPATIKIEKIKYCVMTAASAN